MPQPVLAAAPVIVTADAPAAVEKVEASFGNQILASAIIGLLNAITLMGQQVARDLAVGLASGCRGENACAFTKDPGTYFTAVAYDGAGEFIGNLSESWEFLGFSLCNPRIPDVGLSIALGLAEKFQRPKPKCDFVNTINNWSRTVKEAKNPHALLKHASLAFEPGNTDLGQAATANQEFQIHIKRKEEAEKQKRTEGQGILPQSGIISGNVTTPAAVIKAEYEDLPRSGKDSTITSGDVVSGLIGTKSGGIWSAVGTTVLSTFVNTLASRLLKAAMQGIFGETANTLPDLTQAIGGAFGGPGGRQTAPGLSDIANALLTPQIRVSNGGFEYVSELNACPQKEEERTQFNCSVDDKFMVAIQQSQAGTPLTVAEAMAKGYLNRGAPFGFVNPGNTPPSEPGVRVGYAYSAMKRLRLLRVIPLGWEFAALKIDQDNQSATLGDVVDGYADEGDVAGCQGITADPQESRFCGLVDPNWVLKAPPATCGAIVWSAAVDLTKSGRQEACADLQHCVAEGANGDCQAWGYCTREKNTWRFDADACDKQYASCDTFTPKEGNKQSLLENTVDFGACTADNAGCTAYASAQTQTGVNTGIWQWNANSAPVYLDRDAAKCDQGANGCAELIVPTPVLAAISEDGPGEGVGRQPDAYPADAQKLYYRLPPDYFGCTGEAADQPACAQYSRYCRREEVGCELYTAVTRDAAVPGIAGALDRCPGDCVGYDSYLKLGSRFEPQFTKRILESVIPGYAWLAGAPQEDLYPLIPSGRYGGKACPAQLAGCDEFTNLRTEEREYYADLRACQSPAPDSQTYFTWEGSDTSGYQLRTWSLKRSIRGAVNDDALVRGQAAESARPPCTNYAVGVADDGSIQVSCTDNADNQAVCHPDDETLTVAEQADCRAFYDNAGNIYRRFMSRTIVSTDECQSFRWTGLPRQPEIAPAPGENPDQLRKRLEEAACQASHGFWNTTTSQCLYLGAPSLSQACSAEFSGCRGFRGNTGSNVANVFETETFDPVSIALSVRGWTALGAPTRFEFSGESLVSGEHSLKVEGAEAGEGAARSLTRTAGTTTVPLVTPGASYFLTMNVKGTAGQALKVAVRVSSGAEDAFAEEIRLTPEWRAVEIGPLTLQNITTANLVDPQLVIYNATNRVMTFFIDNVRLQEVRDTVYLVKNSWNVPASCDTLPIEAGGGYSRGAMLGCRAYTDRAGGAHTLKSFASLCRAQSAGCAELIDTRNSNSPFPEQFNTTNTGVCRGRPGECRVDDTVVCIIPDGATSCPYGPQVAETTANLTMDDRSILADTHRYVVVDPAKACQSAQAGCQALGARDASGALQTVYRKNNPNEYSTALCSYEARGCETWTRSDQSVTYFRMPEAGGCVWKTNAVIGTGQYSGWFKATKQPILDSVGNPSALVNIKAACSGYGTWDFVRDACIDANSNSLDGAGDNRCGGVACDVNLCTRGAGGSWRPKDMNSDGVVSPAEGVCESEAPCSGRVVAETVAGHPRIRVDVADTYLIGGNTFGIWRNDDALYAGRAGACPDAQATCTALVDPTDKSEGQDGKAYYLKDNARLLAARKDCDGKVSRAQGCVLLKNEEDPTKLYSAQQSYLDSDRERGDLVPPVPLPPNGNDTNTIIKVQRDRVCAEWYQCAGAEFKWLDKENRYKTVCNVLGRCNAAAVGAEEGGAISACGSWVNHPLLNNPPQIDASACAAAGWAWNGAAQRCAIPNEGACAALGGIWFAGPPTRCELGALKEGAYRLRDRTFGGQDYTGYSIPNLYGINQLREVNIGRQRDPKYRLAFIIPGTSGCTSPGTGDRDDGCPGAQQCTTEGTCARAFDASSDFNTTSSADDWPSGFRNDTPYCRGFPERTSPFPNTAAIRENLNFENVPRCTEADGNEVAGTKCECDYTKAEYSGGTRYYPLNISSDEAPSSVAASTPPDAFCEGRNGAVVETLAGAAVTEATCQNAGFTWQKLKNTRSVYGWPGYCLETDPARLINSTGSVDSARNRQACLTWLPIDRLSSVQDIDSLNTDASYQAGTNVGTTPNPYGAYYCLLGSEVERTAAMLTARAFRDNGHRWISDRDPGNAGDGDIIYVGSPLGNSVLVYTATVPESRGIYRQDIKEVRIRITGGYAGSDINMGSGLGRFAGTRSGEYGPSSGIYTFHPGDVSADARIITPQYLEPLNSGYGGWQAFNFAAIPATENLPESQWWWWGADDNGDNPLRNERAGRITPNAISGAIMTTANFLATSGSATDGSERRLSNTKYTENMDNWLGEGDLGDIQDSLDGVYVALHFDPVTQRLDYIRIGESNLSNNSDFSDFAAGIIDYVRVDLYPHCEYVAKIDPGLASQGSAPNLDCLSTDGFRLDLCNWAGANYGPATPLAPWGSSSAGPAVDITEARHPWFLNHNRLEDGIGDDPLDDSTPLRARFAGWPYGCAETDPNQCTVNAKLNGPSGAITAQAENPWGRITSSVRHTAQEAANDAFAILFAKGGSSRESPVFRWDAGQRKYVPASVSWDKRTGLAPEAGPLLRAVIEGAAGETPDVAVSNVQPLAVNGQYLPGSVVPGVNGFLLANLKFWAMADSKHMPIRKFVVDWGDGDPPVVGNGLYKNAWPDCDDVPSGVTPALYRGFSTSDGACQEQPYNFEHLYACSGVADPNWQAGDACPMEDFQSLYGGCCVFKPKVQAMDNWGFCNGRCEGNVAGQNDGNLCFESECAGTVSSTNNPWSEFAGQVVVAP